MTTLARTTTPRQQRWLCHHHSNNNINNNNNNNNDNNNSSNSNSNHNSNPTVTIQGTIPRWGGGGGRRRGLMSIGQWAETTPPRIFTTQDVNQFASLIRDYNPLHQMWDNVDELAMALRGGTISQQDSTQQQQQQQIDDDKQGNRLEWIHPLVVLDETQSNALPRPKILVHGMLVASLFSCIFGTLIPGAVYISQTIEFRRPVYVGDAVLGRVVIQEIAPTKKQGGLMITCDTQVLRLLPDRSNDGDDNPSSHPNSSSSREKHTKECIRASAKVWLPHADTVEEENSITTDDSIPAGPH